MVPSEVPSVSSPFIICGPLHGALQLAFSESCTRSKHGPERLGAGGSDPTELWAAESRQKWGRSRPSECFARVQILWFRFTHLLTSLLFVVHSIRKLV
jgi:hypothetical protein